MTKPKVGFYWSASCGGCEEAVVDLAERILDVVEAVDIVVWPCAMDFKKADVYAMEPGYIDACFMNGAIRTSEEGEMAEVLREKSKLLIAFGSCAQTGGVPGLGNLYTREEILENSYFESITTVNPDRVLPQVKTTMPEGEVTLPYFEESVKSLDQTVEVDFYIPGCPPPVSLLWGAVEAILKGELPPRGSVLAPNLSLCKECPHIESKPDKVWLSEVKRPHEIIIDSETCLLAQGVICLGPGTRGGCEARCIGGNMPCTGCMGPVDEVQDYGMSALKLIASIIDSDDEAVIDQIIDQIPDLVGTFNRYSLPKTYLYRRLSQKVG